MHTLFNISTTILLIPFGNYLAKLATKILPEKAEEKEHHKHLKYIKSVDTRVDATFGTSAINLQNLRNEIQRMLEMARVNVEESFDAFLAGSSRFLGDVDKREDYIDYLNKEISRAAAKMMAHETNVKASKNIGSYLDMTSNIERIGDHAVNICDYTKLIEEKHIVFSDDAKQQMEEMKMICEKMFHNISKVPEDTQEWLQKVHDSENFIDQKTEEFYESHLERINRGECNDEACIIFSEMLTDFERIGDHTWNVAKQMAKIIDGKALAAATKAEAAAEAAALKVQGIEPCLAVILVGENPASQVYVRGKVKDCGECGIKSLELRMPETTTQEELLAKIAELAADKTVNGILVQLPLPKQIDERAVIDAIPPEKDVDGFSPVNVGRMQTGQPCFLPCTPAGCIRMIESTGTKIDGKNAVVIGRSNIVGKPAALLLLAKNATVTVCHSHTANLKEICANADILVAAVGRAGFVTGDMVKPGAVVIDVGINRGADGKLHGDVNFEEASAVAGYITPVPGGVGPMTRAMLMKNTTQAAAMQNGVAI